MANNPMQLFAQIMSSGKNPQQLLEEMVKKNPQMQVLVNQIQQSGMKPREFAQQYFKQNNLDFAQAEQMANQFGIK